MHTILDNREEKYLVPQPLGGGVYTVVQWLLRFLTEFCEGWQQCPPSKSGLRVTDFLV